MSHVQRLAISVVTDALGAATAYSDNFTGLISQLRYVKPGAGSFTNGVDFTITLEATGETVWAEQDVNASATRAPRQATHGTDGAAALYAGSGTAVRARIAAANDRLKIVIADGGDTKNGLFYLLVE